MSGAARSFRAHENNIAEGSRLAAEIAKRFVVDAVPRSASAVGRRYLGDDGQVNTVPTNDAAIEALCTEAGCGTIFLDLTKPVELPRTFVRNLFSDHFHLWTIAVAPAAEEACRCLDRGRTSFRSVPSGFVGRAGTPPYKTPRSRRTEDGYAPL